MKPRYFIRWMVEQGSSRFLMRYQALRGDPFGKLFGTAAARHNPYPHIEALRQRGRLVPTPVTWVTADYELSRSILRDTRFGVFILDNPSTPEPLRRVIRKAPLPANPVEPPSMLTIDPPDHTRIRKSVSAAFTPRAVGRLRDRVESVTVELLDALPSNGSADLIASYAAQIPIAIISEMLGFPDSDREHFLRWGDKVSPLLDLGLSWGAWRTAAMATQQMDRYLDGHIDRLRREPGDDILSSLVTAGNLDDRELKATATLLMGAGFETTVNLIGNAVVQLLPRPRQLEQLVDDPELWPQAVEEVLRFDPPVQTTARQALCDIDIDGRTMRRGTAVVLSLAGANRDPKMFDDPNSFDINRPNAQQHLTFSSGIHTCLGASLARMEATYALRSLFERFPDLRLAGTPELRPLFTLHGYSHLPVHLGPRARATV
ncbi:cytochrome P450 [Nocardia uniformis]|uniref:Cytochrome P450 n=1 Tax=Nocardia uniformis TaxID=53432 RepID=A0A849BZQ0_9NOCA|nr:cytochrome P450 [Nocardia uniformis]NNH69720.1 cytochrome P450 [Nocardia uniformis]